MSNSNIHIFMDIDGVLLTSDFPNPLVERSWDVILKEKFSIDPTLMTELFFKKYFIHILLGKKDLKEALNEFLLKIGKSSCASDIIECWFESGRECINQHLMHRIMKLRHDDKNRLYIATNQEKYRANYIWDHFNFKKTFHKIYFSAEVGHLKSSRYFYEVVNKDLCLTKDDIVLFFDDEINNVKVANNNGWQSFLYTGIDCFVNNPFIKRLIEN